MGASFDPVVLFFLLGFIGAVARSNLKIPTSIYVVLSAYLLLAIGIKGGIELYKSHFGEIIVPALVTVVLGVGITLLAYALLRWVFRFDLPNAIALAMHYGSVSAVTYAVVINYLIQTKTEHEQYVTVLLILLEIPAIVTGSVMANMLLPKAEKAQEKKTSLREMLTEILFGKSILLLVGGLVIGYYTMSSHNTVLHKFYIDLFQGFLAIFLLDMGFVTGRQWESLKNVGFKLALFAIGMPLLSAVLGILAANMAGLSPGGAVVLGTMAASASYIAAPTAAKMVLPQANPTYYMTAALGITFPFNVVVGVPLYYQLTMWLYG